MSNTVLKQSIQNRMSKLKYEIEDRLEGVSSALLIKDKVDCGITIQMENEMKYLNDLLLLIENKDEK